MNLTLVRFGAFGDCVLLGPLVAHLRENGATAVTVVTKAAHAELFACTDGVDRVISLAPGAGFRGLHAIARRLRNDDGILIDAHNTMRSRLLCRWAGGAIATFTKQYRERLELIIFKRRRPLPTMLDKYGALGNAIGAPTDSLSPGGFRPPAGAAVRAEQMLPGDEPTIALAPGSRWTMKRWPVERFAEVARNVATGMGYRIVLLGDRHDTAAAAHVAGEIGPACLDATGDLSIVETGALLTRCVAFAGNDSGLMHLAEAVGVPVVGVFGPTVREFGYYPSLARSRTVEKALACRPCSRNGAIPCLREDHACMRGVSVENVMTALRGVVENSGESSTVIA